MNSGNPTDTSAPARDTNGRGDITEFAVMYALARMGKKVLRPTSSAMRYDLLVDNDDGTFVRIQCKTGFVRNGRIEFRLYSISGHNTRGRGYRGQVDAFGVHCPQTADTYLVPVSAIANCGSVASLRVVPARNGQIRGTRLAREFLITPVGEPIRPACPGAPAATP